jgi:hypothetical protein
MACFEAQEAHARAAKTPKDCWHSLQLQKLLRTCQVCSMNQLSEIWKQLATVNKKEDWAVMQGFLASQYNNGNRHYGVVPLVSPAMVQDLGNITFATHDMDPKQGLSMFGLVSVNLQEEYSHLHETMSIYDDISAASRARVSYSDHMWIKQEFQGSLAEDGEDVAMALSSLELSSEVFWEKTIL